MGWIRLIILSWSLTAESVFAGPSLEIVTNHPCHPGAPDSIWLKEYRMMRMQVQGPGRLALSFRQVLIPDRVSGPVDLTIVRDDREQGTIRFSTPEGQGKLSKAVVVLIDIPSGEHTFRLLVSGPQRGVVVKRMEGKPDTGTNVIEVTTSLQKVKGLKLGMLDKTNIPRKKPRLAPRSEMKSKNEILDSVSASQLLKGNPQTTVLYNNPNVPTSTLGPGAMMAGGTMFVFLLSSASLAVSAGVQSQRSRQDPSRADEYLSRARRTSRAASIMAGAAGVALITAVVMYLLQDADSVGSINGTEAGFGMRF